MKSMIYTAGSATMTAAGIVPVGSVIRRFGCAIRTDGNSVFLGEPGYYQVSAAANLIPTATGNVSMTINENGSTLATATAEGTASEAMQLILPAAVSRVYCSGSPKTVNIAVSAPATVSSLYVTVDKL